MHLLEVAQQLINHFFSARTEMRCTIWISRSTRPSMISWPLPTEGCQQGVPNRLRVSPHLTGRLGRCTEPILPEDFRLYRCEEVGR